MMETSEQCVKSAQSIQYFPAFGLNTKRYFVSLRIQSEWGKIRTRENSVFGHFSRSVFNRNIFTSQFLCTLFLFQSQGAGKTFLLIFFVLN